jgi:hypothetical protein
MRDPQPRPAAALPAELRGNAPAETPSAHAKLPPAFGIVPRGESPRAVPRAERREPAPARPLSVPARPAHAALLPALAAIGTPPDTPGLRRAAAVIAQAGVPIDPAASAPGRPSPPPIDGVPARPHAGRDQAVDPEPRPAVSAKASAIALAARTVSGDDALASAVRAPSAAARPPIATPAVVFPISPGPIVIGPVTAPGLPDVPAPHNVDRIVQTIRLAWARGVGDAQIRLEPGRFGDLTVSLRVEHGQVIARLQSDVPAVREWLQANQATFRQGLADHHLDLNRLEVVAARTSVDDPAGREERRREPSDQPPARRPRRPHTGEMFDIVA